jgi:hypothetical protein
MKGKQEIAETAAVCGLYCGACGIYIATQESDMAKLENYAKMMNQTVDETRCNGCRSSVVTTYCKRCKFTKCASEKGIGFCGECNEYPCAELKEFQAMMPHRAELWESQKRIMEVGWEKWINERHIYFSCKQCSTVNTAYDMKCRKCGAMPGNEFVINHSESIHKFFAGRKQS